jgi:perosamine synthetase
VIVPEITWIATSAPITYVGATPVFADIDPDSWCLSPASCQAWITPRTKVMIPVDLYGNMPDMDGLRCVATQHHIAIIEDAAQAIGSEYKGRKAGSLGDTGTFSFHGSKTLTTGEGGLLVTNREEVYQRALFLRDHGRPPGDKMFFNTEVAYKYKMSSMQAALGLAQLERIEELTCRKREIFSWYEDALSDVEGLTLNYQAPGAKSSYWMVTVVLDAKMGIDKNRLLQAMDEMNIDCRPFFHPLSSLPAYATQSQAEQARQRNTISYQISPYAINLPSGFNMTLEKVGYVSGSLKEIVRQSRLARV